MREKRCCPSWHWSRIVSTKPRISPLLITTTVLPTLLRRLSTTRSGESCLTLFLFLSIALFPLLTSTLYSNRQKCSYYFEPKEHRPPSSNPEYLIGSHLLNHFSDSGPASNSIKTDYNALSFEENILAIQEMITQNFLVKEKHGLILVGTLSLVFVVSWFSSCPGSDFLVFFSLFLFLCHCFPFRNSSPTCPMFFKPLKMTDWRIKSARVVITITITAITAIIMASSSC
jgi:hypothetical protein